MNPLTSKDTIVTVEWQLCSPVARYALIRGKPEDFTDIVVSTTMIIDHAPDLYHQEIHRLLHDAKNTTTVR